MYDTAEQLEAKIAEYLLDCKENNIPLTICGLCLSCGFESRQSFYAYEKKDGFSYTIKRARLIIQMSYEMRLSGANATGSIFALKNFGWTDNQSIQHEISFGNLSDDELISRINTIASKD